jgi:DNA-3-methyladenine glycosylase II
MPAEASSGIPRGGIARPNVARCAVLVEHAVADRATASVTERSRVDNRSARRCCERQVVARPLPTPRRAYRATLGARTWRSTGVDATTLWYTGLPRESCMRFPLTVNGPLDPEATLARYHVWGDDPVNRVGPGVFRRVLTLEGKHWPYEVRWSGPVDDVRLSVHVPGARSPRIATAVSAEVRKILGLDFDLAAFYRFAKADPALSALIGPLHGLRPTLAPTALEMLVGSITAQQITLGFAFACRARLVRRWGTPLEIGGEPVHAFPEADVLARAPVDDFRAMKFSTRKAEYIRDVARAVAAGELALARLDASTNDAVIQTITELRGLGRWTAEWFLARCLGRGDVCPAGDLGVRRAFERYYGRGRSLGEEAVRRRARAWLEHRNVAVHYLLAGLRLKIPAGDGTWTGS